MNHLRQQARTLGISRWRTMSLDDLQVLVETFSKFDAETQKVEMARQVARGIKTAAGEPARRHSGEINR